MASGCLFVPSAHTFICQGLALLPLGRTDQSLTTVLPSSFRAILCSLKSTSQRTEVFPKSQRVLPLMFANLSILEAVQNNGEAVGPEEMMNI